MPCKYTGSGKSNAYISRSPPRDIKTHRAALATTCELFSSPETYTTVPTLGCWVFNTAEAVSAEAWSTPWKSKSTSAASRLRD